MSHSKPMQKAKRSKFQNRSSCLAPSAGGIRPMPGDPTEAGSLAELFPDGRVPWSVASVLNAKLWCPKVEAYVAMEDPARVFVGPSVGWGE